MKKIIYSIVTALIVSITLTLISPSWFLMDDALWTYKSKGACVDIDLAGNLKNGRVRAQSIGVQSITQVERKAKNYQGATIRLPISYREKSYGVKITPQADVWGENAEIVLKFRGTYYLHAGKNRPAWVSFRNIALNGKPLVKEKVVWHNQPFILKCPPHTEGITLTFDALKPFAVYDIAFVNILVVFFACLLIGLLFAPPNAAANRILEFINGRNIIKVLLDSYRHIDPVYCRSFWIIFGVLCFAFGFHTTQFMWGYHDWSLLASPHRWSEHAFEGRYMVSSIKALLSNGVYLPFIYDLIIFITLAINAVLLCKYWRLEKRVTYFVLCGLALTVQPITLDMICFINMTPETFIGVTCALIALLLSEKIISGGVPLTKKIVYSFIAIALVNFSLAMYQVLISTIAVALTGRMLVQSLDWDGSWQKLKSCLNLLLTSGINIALGGALYKLIVTFVFPMISTRYNTDTLPLTQVPERLGVLFEQCFHQLYEYNFPFMYQWILWTFLGFFILLAFYLCYTGTLGQKMVRLSLLYGSLFATQTAMLIAKRHLVAGRVELFGLVFFDVLVMVLVMTRLRKLHNLWVIVGTCIVFSSVLTDLDCLRVWKLGFDAEKMLWNRVLARLEIQKEFDPTKKYDVVQIGDPISIRPRFYVGKKGLDFSPILDQSYDPDFSPFSPHATYYPANFRKRGFASTYARKNASIVKDYEARLKRLYQAGVLQRAEVWPKSNGLIVWDDIILFVTDGKELHDVKKRFEWELGRK